MSFFIELSWVCLKQFLTEGGFSFYWKTPIWLFSTSSEHRPNICAQKIDHFVAGWNLCVCMWCAKFTEFVMISRCMKKLTNSSVTCEVWNIWGDQTRWQVTSLISKSSDTLIYRKTKLTYTFHHISTFDLQSYYSKNLSWLWWTNDPQRVLVHLENLS